MEIQRYTIDSQRRDATSATLVSLDDLRKLANVGDTIVEFNGTAIGSWDEMSELIRANGDGDADGWCAANEGIAWKVR